MGKHNWTRVDEGRKSCNLLAIKMQGTNRSGEAGGKSLLCDPGSELRLGGRENRRRAKIIHDGMEKEKEKEKACISLGGRIGTDTASPGCRRVERTI